MDNEPSRMGNTGHGRARLYGAARQAASDRQRTTWPVLAVALRPGHHVIDQDDRSVWRVVDVAPGTGATQDSSPMVVVTMTHVTGPCIGGSHRTLAVSATKIFTKAVVR